MRAPPWMPVLRGVACVCAVLCVVIVAATATARGTVLNAGFHRDVLARERAYDRLYDEVLVDPDLTPVTRELLGRLPVNEAVLTSNLKTVLPPETLRALTDEQIAHLIEYLRGDRDALTLSADLRPVVDNLGHLTQTYFGDLVASLQERPAPDFPAFLRELDASLAQVAAGEPPAGLPKLSLTSAQAATASDALLRFVPEGRREALRPEVELALRDGDVATALASVGPAVFSDRTREAVERVRTAADNGSWNITADLERGDGSLDTVHRIRGATHLTLGVMEPLAALLGAAALAALWFTGPDSLARRLRHLGWTLAAGGILTALAVAVLSLAAGGRVVTPPPSWPDSLSRLVDDIQSTALDRVLSGAVTAALVALAAGATVLALGLAVQRRPVLEVARRASVWSAAGVTAVALSGVALVPLAFAGGGSRVCQGDARLCDLRYDEVAQLTSHNAMSTTADRFIGPLQDPDVTGQLNAGVRALQLDTYRWERPEEVTARLAESDFPPETRQRIVDAVTRFNPPRPGLWLCHSVCRAGAVELVPALRRIGDWLRAHPTEVVTLVVQDSVGGADTEAAFREAGLEDLLHTPDRDPDRRWPTLGDMIDSGRRLVVFAERGDGPAPWYRNFYDYAMETPYAFRDPAEMSCVPHRGGTDKRLFLLNHFVTIDGGSRLDAARVNARDSVLDRAHACERARGRPVTFVAVDYVTIGEARAAVDALNAERIEGS
ncbi:PI-PLC domain-containing protein [Streptomyces sp. NPDC008121]|uniref:PI-PLC domain-containing protein n=1 Tax=Streptomyces sp. NPDC008121 TaxID=3364809 RepID=UPI0036F06A4D